MTVLIASCHNGHVQAGPVGHMLKVNTRDSTRAKNYTYNCVVVATCSLTVVWGVQLSRACNGCRIAVLGYWSPVLRPPPGILMSTSMSVHLCACLFGTTCPFFTKFLVQFSYGRDSVLPRRRCSVLSSLINSIHCCVIPFLLMTSPLHITAETRQCEKGAYSEWLSRRQHWWRTLKVTHRRAAADRGQFSCCWCRM